MALKRDEVSFLLGEREHLQHRRKRGRAFGGPGLPTTTSAPNLPAMIGACQKCHLIHAARCKSKDLDEQRHRAVQMEPCALADESFPAQVA